VLNHIWFKHPIYQPISDCVAGIWSALLLIRASESTNMLRTALSVKPLVWIGGFSYSLYLIHAPVVQIIWQYAINPLHLGQSEGYLLQVLTGIPLTIVLAFGFSLMFERPLMTAHGFRLRLPS
jgi:peptidoglycan/LPS O-acetylase OafA/YrhL